MKAGDLRHRVTIQNLKAPVNTGGVAPEVFETFAANVPAAIEPLRGREYWEAQKVNSEVSTKIRIRYRAGLLPTMRVLLGSRVFLIEAVLNIEERNREIHLMCREVYP